MRLPSWLHRRYTSSSFVVKIYREAGIPLADDITTPADLAAMIQAAPHLH